jgi:hypothetical protein
MTFTLKLPAFADSPGMKKAWNEKDEADQAPM